MELLKKNKSGTFFETRRILICFLVLKDLTFDKIIHFIQ